MQQIPQIFTIIRFKIAQKIRPPNNIMVRFKVVHESEMKSQRCPVELATTYLWSDRLGFRYNVITFRFICQILLPCKPRNDEALITLDSDGHSVETPGVLALQFDFFVSRTPMFFFAIFPQFWTPSQDDCILQIQGTVWKECFQGYVKK